MNLAGKKTAKEAGEEEGETNRAAYFTAESAKIVLSFKCLVFSLKSDNERPCERSRGFFYLISATKTPLRQVRPLRQAQVRQGIKNLRVKKHRTKERICIVEKLLFVMLNPSKRSG
jgi:hypothetical protein